MTSNMTPLVQGLQHTQYAINALSDIYKKDTEVISAIRDPKNARRRIVEVMGSDVRHQYK